MEGTVFRSTGSWYDVRTDDGEAFACRAKGKLRLKGDRSTNPVAIGDRVDFAVEEDGTGVVSRIHERRNRIVRRAVNLARESHVVAANVDRAFLVVTVGEPATSSGFIDRFLVSAEAFGVPTTLVFNKVDAVRPDTAEADRLEELEANYGLAGYRSVRTSALTGEGVEDLAQILTAGNNLFSGHSGVGKSSLINRLVPGLELRTSEVSETHGKGKHTTTFAEMFPLPERAGFIMDTPGIKGFGLVHLERDTLHHHFPELFERLPDCRFHNCLHRSEPGCAVREAVESGDIAAERYFNYLELYEGWDEQNSYR